MHTRSLDIDPAASINHHMKSEAFMIRMTQKTSEEVILHVMGMDERY